jgi:site-specific DNA-cytosine methylase
MVSEHVWGVYHVCGGLGGGALGFQQAREVWSGTAGRFHTLGGCDSDPEACEDFRVLTGVEETCLDLFDRRQYEDFHGKAPPHGWSEVQPDDIRRSAGGECPDMLVASYPCKGFSGLLPGHRAETPKYQALNGLVLRGTFLAMEAFADDPPAVILMENVPRIATRGAHLLSQVKSLLNSYGYVVQEGFYDCGQVGGLAQHRRRYILIARHPGKLPSFIHFPPARRVRACGEVLGPLPLPDDPAGGPMHRLPRLEWRTWVRLALIPAGGDWRDLERIGRNWFDGAYRIVPWGEPAGTVTTGASPSCGAVSVADPRLGYVPQKGSFRILRWDEPGTTVIGSASVRGSNGAAAVADPRIGCRPRNGSYGVMAWNEPAKTILGAADVHAGTAAVADPRLPGWSERPDPPPVIVAPDDTWHRPLTTLELAALQGFPVFVEGGRPLRLAGPADSRWRGRIGNAMPPPAAREWAATILRSLLASLQGACVLSGEGIWVAPFLREVE